MSSLSASTRKTSGTPVVILDASTRSNPSDDIYLLDASLGNLSKMGNATYCRVCLLISKKTLHLTFIPADKRRVFMRFRGFYLKQLPLHTQNVLVTNKVKISSGLVAALINVVPLKNQIVCVCVDKPFLPTAVHLWETKTLVRKALSGASDAQDPEKLPPTLSPALPVTMQHCASQHGNMTIEE